MAAAVAGLLVIDTIANGTEDPSGTAADVATGRPGAVQVTGDGTGCD